MTLTGAIKQLHELRAAEDMPVYYKPAIAEVINVLLMDAQEVRHGWWVKMSDSDGEYWACSECGKELFRKWVFDREFDILPHLKSVDKTPYCPWCGAQMDAEKGDSDVNLD